MSTQFSQQPPFDQPNQADFPAGDSSPDAATSTSYGYGPGYGAGLSSDSELSLVHYLQILYRRRYIAVSAFLVVFFGVTLYTVTASRIYQATTRILIERDTPNVVSFQEVLDQGAQTDDYYETQYAILRGRGLARRTIEALDLWTHPLLNQQPGFSVRGLIMTPFNAMQRWFEPPRPIEAPGAEETAAQSRMIDRFLANLNVEAVRYSRLVDVTYRTSDPVLAAKIANALGEAYIKQNVEFTSSTTKEASTFLTQQLAEQRAKLEKSEQALQAYREQTDSVSRSEEH